MSPELYIDLYITKKNIRPIFIISSRIVIYNYGDMVKGTDKYLGLYGLQLVQYIHTSQY